MVMLPGGTWKQCVVVVQWWQLEYVALATWQSCWLGCGGKKVAINLIQESSQCSLIAPVTLLVSTLCPNATLSRKNKKSTIKQSTSSVWQQWCKIAH